MFFKFLFFTIIISLGNASANAMTVHVRIMSADTASAQFNVTPSADEVVSQRLFSHVKGVLDGKGIRAKRTFPGSDPCKRSASCHTLTLLYAPDGTHYHFVANHSERPAPPLKATTSLPLLIYAATWREGRVPAKTQLYRDVTQYRKMLLARANNGVAK
ncbi:MAG: hypothetical protein KDD51_05080 [Bdellovibrionales bacterium]|nr:hypothetical protein [Bdellovibrionales bacterium]